MRPDQGNHMPPRREEFILGMREAVRARLPVFIQGEPETPEWIQQELRWAGQWLTPKVIEKYDPSDFDAFVPEQRESLRLAVEEFRAIVAALPSGGPQSRDDIRRGRDPFNRLQSAVREIVLGEWRQAATAIVVEAERWAGKRGWRCRRTEKDLFESLLGPYALPQSELYAEQHLFVLDPVARFVPGAIGSFDLALQPSMYTTTIYRNYDGSWNVHLHPGGAVRNGQDVPWGEEAFQEAITELGSLV
jgi:hypothetical protein